jgi:splicing factor 1
MARDCTVGRGGMPGMPGPPPPGDTNQFMDPNRSGFDSEYASLMAELGEGGKSTSGAPAGAIGWTGGAAHDVPGGGSNVPPWRRPEMWNTNVPPPNNQPRPPQQAGGYGGGYGGPPAGYGAQGWGGQPGGGYPQQGGYPPADYPANYAQYYQGQQTA